MAKEETDFEIKFFERLVADNPDFVDALIPLAELYTRKGIHEKALELDLRLVKLKPEDEIAHYNLACSLALMGKKEEAIQALQRSIEQGYDDFKHMKRDPDLAALRDDPRFKALLLSGKQE